MARTKRRIPYNPALAEYNRQQAEHADVEKRSRIATDFNRGIAQHIVAMEIADPLGQNGERIIAARQTRNDPLGRLFARKSIDSALYEAGRAYQGDWEIVEGGARAIDPSQPYVDCSRRPRSVSGAYSKALARLNVVHGALGQDGAAIVLAVLIRGMSMAKVAASRGFFGERWEKYFGLRFRECLDCLAVEYGFAMRRG